MTRGYGRKAREEWERNRRVREYACGNKTARGNVYRTRGDAWPVVLAIRRETGDPVRVYRCGVCGLWHVGKRRARA